MSTSLSTPEEETHVSALDILRGTKRRLLYLLYLLA